MPFSVGTKNEPYRCAFRNVTLKDGLGPFASILAGVPVRALRRDHIFYLPVRFTDPCIYKDPAYKKNVFAEEMRSKGFLDARMVMASDLRATVTDRERERDVVLNRSCA